MSAITAKASRKMKKYAVLTREPRCFLGSFDFSWEQRKLGELGTITTGNTPSTSIPDYYSDDGIVWVTPTDICENITFESARKLSDLGQQVGRVVPKNTILVTCIASIGKNTMLGNTGSFNQQINGLTPNENKYDPYFLLTESALWSAKMKGSAASGTMQIVNRTEFSELKTWLPSLIEQQTIGAFFKQLDNLITLHQRKCVFLFGFFQAFISMIFTASTFSWEQRKFDEVFDCTVPNNTLSRAELSYDEGTVLNVHYGDVLIKYGSVLDVQKDDIPRIPHRCREDFNGALLQDGDVIIADTAEDETTGKACEIGNLQGSAIVSGLHTMVCRPRNRMALGYLGYYLNSNAYHHQLLPLMQGIKVLSLSRSNIQKTSVSYPIAVKEQQLIAYYFSQLDNLITLHQRECISFTARAGRLILTANKKRNTSSWEQRKLGELVDRVVRKNINNESTLPLTISAQYGLVDQITYFNNRVASRDVSNYYLVLNGEFAYNKSTSDGYPFGAVKRLDLHEKGVLSTLYIVFAPKKEQQIDSDYLTVFFDTDRWHKGVAERAAEGARNHGLLNISAEDFFDIDLSVPKDIVEQKQIGAFIRQLDDLITLHQRKPFLMKWRTSDANRNQTNRLVL